MPLIKDACVKYSVRNVLELHCKKLSPFFKSCATFVEEVLAVKVFTVRSSSLQQGGGRGQTSKAAEAVLSCSEHCSVCSWSSEMVPPGEAL